MDRGAWWATVRGVLKSLDTQDTDRLMKGSGNSMVSGSMTDKYRVEVCSLFTKMLHRDTMVFTVDQGGQKMILA